MNNQRSSSSKATTTFCPITIPAKNEFKIFGGSFRICRLFNGSIFDGYTTPQTKHFLLLLNSPTLQKKQNIIKPIGLCKFYQSI